MRLDALDVKIVGLLQEDARLSFREIAERLGSTTPTVSARVKALEDIGLVRGYRAQLDHAVLGGASYVVALTVQPPHARGALERVRGLPGVHTVHLLAGGRLHAHLHLRPGGLTLAQLDDAIAEIPGLITYEASQVIEGHEVPSHGSLPESVEVPCHQCKGPIHGDPVKGKFGDRTHVFCCRQCLGTFRERYEGLQKAASPATRLKVATPPRAQPADLRAPDAGASAGGHAPGHDHHGHG